MACFTLRGPNGDRQIAENENYQLQVGEAIVPGLIDWTCEGVSVSANDDFQAQLANEGIQWGDAIAWATKKAKLKQCGGCQARQVIFNNASQVGWVATFKAIKDTFKK